MRGDTDVSSAQFETDEHRHFRGLQALKGAIDLAKNSMSSSSSRHVDARYHFLRESTASGDISVK